MFGFAMLSASQQQLQKCSLRQYYDHTTNDTLTALHLFCRSGSRYRYNIKEIIDLCPQLISYPTPNGGDTPLHFAVAAQDLQTTRLLLQRNPGAASVKSGTRGNFGSEVTPLHVAIVINADFEMIKLLVQATPRSAKLRNGNGQTTCELAIQFCEGEDNVEEILACLLRTNKTSSCHVQDDTPRKRKIMQFSR